MKKINFKKFLLGFFVIIALFLTSCVNKIADKSDDTSVSVSIPTLTGYWKSSYGDGFEIKSNQFFQYDDSSKTVSFAGNIVNNPVLSSAQGYITVQITNAGTWSYTVNNYTVISWTNFNGTTCKESTPYSAGNPSFLPTQSAAESTFTIANGYYTMYGTYTKQ